MMVAKRQSGESWLEESDRWDRMSLDEIMAISEPDEDIKFIDARPKKAISLRLNEELIQAAKKAAQEMGVGYQTLFRMWLIEGLRHHRERKAADRPSRKTRPAA